MSGSQTTILNIKNLKMYYDTLRGKVKAVDGVNLSLNKSDSLGLAGESGCGKTSIIITLLRLLPNNAKIIEGEILFKNVDLVKMPPGKLRSEIRWKRISVIFQGAMNALHPIIPIGKQITEAITLHEKTSREEAEDRAGKLLDLVGIGAERITRYPHELSGGLKQRTMIAMALACNPELVLADEPTTALDVIIEAQVLKVMRELQKKLGLSMIMISHDLSMIAEVCNKIAIMYAGKIVEYGDITAAYKDPLHPYTQRLIAAFPSILGRKTELVSIPGFPPDLLVPPPGCRFHPRCPYAMDVCKKKEPSVTTPKDKEHWVSCHLYR